LFALVVTLIESVPPPAPKTSEVFESEKVQADGGEGCVGELLPQPHKGAISRMKAGNQE
jgi:hypothetical protein